MATHVYAWTHIMDFTFEIFCATIIFSYDFRVFFCVIWAIIMMCLLFSAPEYVQMQWYGSRQSKSPGYQPLAQQYSKSIYIGTLYISSTVALKFSCLLSRQFSLVLWFTNCVLLSDDNNLIPGCLWVLAFILNNILILGIWCSTIPHLPVCFCLWTFFQNIRFNMVPSDPFVSHLATQLGYYAGEFQALQLIVLATFGVVD